MKKFAIILFCGALYVTACSKHEKPVPENNNPEEQPQQPTQRRCATMDVLARQLKEDPSLARRMADIEAATQKAIRNGAIYRLRPDGSIEIPIVVNVLYRTAAENISDAQIQSQIEILEKDFNGLNVEYPTVPAPFDAVKAVVGIHFSLKAVNRKSTTVSTWGINDNMKRSSSGGINPTTPDSVLNIWVVGAMSGGVIGYAQFPGGSPSTDGVVVADDCFGNNGTATSPFHLGRTATHEIGHYLNLRHIWGDNNCGNDQVGDTPLHNAANFGCPTHPHRSTCSGRPIEMFQNFMDYTDDRCMSAFTKGQKDRMLATFTSSGGRYGFAH